jgi:multiple sugar transport system permease protein
MEFIGVDNFTRMTTDIRFIEAFKNTIIYSGFTVPITLFIALGLALLLNQRVKGRNLFRTAIFFPYVASLVAVAAVWNMLFSPANGPINMILVHLGVAVENLPKWAADKDFAMMTVIMFSVWKSMGYYMVIYLAGLQGISAELYEAASLDGANPWQKFKSITWPMLQPTTFFVVVMLTINCFKVYDQVYMITQGGPGTSTLVLVYHIYETAFRSWDLGYASAVAVILFLLVLVITIIQFKGEKKYANS